MDENEERRLQAMKLYFQQKKVRRPQDNPEEWQRAIEDIDRALAAHPVQP